MCLHLLNTVVQPTGDVNLSQYLHQSGDIFLWFFSALYDPMTPFPDSLMTFLHVRDPDICGGNVNY